MQLVSMFSYQPATVFVCETAAVVILFYSLPSWLIFRVRSASWLSGVGALLLLLSGVGLTVSSLRSSAGRFSLHGLDTLERVACFLGLATVVFAILLAVAAACLKRATDQQTTTD